MRSRIKARASMGFLLPIVLSLLFLLMVLTSMLVYTGANARKYVMEARISNEEEQAITESHIYWEGDLDSGNYTQENPNPTKEYVANPLTDKAFQMKANFAQNKSMNCPLPTNPAMDPQKIPSMGYQKPDDSPDIGYDETWIPPWHCYIALESPKKANYKTMYSAAFPYGIYAPRGSVTLSAARSYSNPTVDKAVEADWVEDTSRAGMQLNIVAQDDINIDDYPHGYAYSLKGEVKITNKNGAIGLRKKEMGPDFAAKYEEDAINAFDEIKKTTMDKSHFLFGRPFEYGLFVGLVYSMYDLVINFDNPQFASMLSLEQGNKFPFLTIPTIKERFGGMIWQLFIHYPDTCDRILPAPEDDDYAKAMEQYQKVVMLMNGAASLDYCWCNPDIDPSEEDDWQKRYLKLDVLCPPGCYFTNDEFLARQYVVREDTLQKLIERGKDSEYKHDLEGFAIDRHQWTVDDLKEIRDDYLADKKLYKVYTCDADLRYEVSYKNSKDDKDWTKDSNYHYNLTGVQIGVTWTDNKSDKDIKEDLEDKAEDLGKTDEVQNDAMAQYQSKNGQKAAIKISDPKDVTITNPVLKEGGKKSFSQKRLYDEEAYKHHKEDIWPGKTSIDDAWEHLNHDARDKNKWFDSSSLFDREMYVKYGFLLDVEKYAEDEDFPDKPDDSRYDEMSLLTEIKKVPHHGEEPYDKFGIPGCNYGKLFYNMFKGVYDSFKDFAKALTKGDPKEFFQKVETNFEQERRLVHFRGGKIDAIFSRGNKDEKDAKDTVTITSDWTVPRGRTLKLDCNLQVIGDVWIQDGATLYVSGDLKICGIKDLSKSEGSSNAQAFNNRMINGGSSGSGKGATSSATSNNQGSDDQPEQKLANGQIELMNKGKKEYFEPSGRVFLGKGSNLLVGGDFSCTGSPEKGSILVDSEVEDITYITSSILCKGNITIPHGILPGMSPTSLGTYLDKKGVKNWKKFLRDVELVSSQVAKVAGPFEKRYCCFARYPDPFTILNLTDFGLPILIPFPSFFSTRTNMNIGIFRGLSLTYFLILNGTLGENLFTDSRWWSLLREDELYSETKVPKEEEVKEYIYSKECEEAFGGVPVFPKLGSKSALENCANAFKNIAVKDMDGYAMNARFCLEITMYNQICEVLMAKLFEEIFVEIFKDVFEGTEFLKDFGEKGCEKIGEWFAEMLFNGKVEEYEKSLLECNPAPAVMTLGIAYNIYMKSKAAELTKILSEKKPDYLITETSGLLIYSGRKIKIGNKDQSAGSCIFAPGLFIANSDIESYADRTVGCMISVNGSISARDFHYYPYFTRASLNKPAQIKSAIWVYIKEFFVGDNDNYKSTEPPMEVGETIYHVTGEGWDR